MEPDPLALQPLTDPLNVPLADSPACVTVTEQETLPLYPPLLSGVVLSVQLERLILGAAAANPEAHASDTAIQNLIHPRFM